VYTTVITDAVILAVTAAKGQVAHHHVGDDDRWLVPLRLTTTKAVRLTRTSSPDLEMVLIAEKVEMD
jgi:hypothetical protein